MSRIPPEAYRYRHGDVGADLVSSRPKIAMIEKHEMHRTFADPILMPQALYAPFP